MDKNLRAFLAVVRHQSLTSASEHLGLTQPSVTKRIANLEDEIGTALFDRNRRGMSLTAAGQVFLRRARRIEAEYRQCHEEVSSISAAGLEILKIGAGPLFHLRWAAWLIAELKNGYPDLKIELSSDTKPDIGEALRTGDMDVYLGVVPPDQLDDSIHFKHVTQVEHGLVVRADNPLARQSKIDPIDLKDFHWVIFAVDPETESRIHQYTVPDVEFPSGIDVRTTSFAAGLQLVKEGGFVMSAPLQLASRVESEGLIIRPTRQGMPRRNAGVHVRKSSLGYGAVQTVLSFFEKGEFEK